MANIMLKMGASARAVHQSCFPDTLNFTSKSA